MRGRTSDAACAALSGSRCPGRETRAPAPYRQCCDIHATGQRGHFGEQVRVPGEVNTHRPLQQVPEGGQPPADRIAAAIVDRAHRLDRDAAHGDPVAGVDLDDVPYAAPAQEHPAATRRDHRAVARYLPQRWRIEVVVMRV